MNNKSRRPKSAPTAKGKAEQDRELSRDLEMTFPASDPPSATEPGGGETGPEVAKDRPARKPSEGAS